ncbi:DUF4376 domain-containing protein [Pontibacter sp. JAM-7]|uniref:DUF4376 domain-containing protein n=1 Tax=Pontibacter sp. JAM-7 TaxID=3366581 RepID=UPI003AF7B25F
MSRYTNGTDTHPFKWFETTYPNKSLPRNPEHWDIPDGPWWFAPSLPAPEIPIEQRIKSRRIQAMNAGTTFNGMIVETDDISQQRITGAAMAAFLDGTLVTHWKTPEGFMPLTAPVIIQVATHVGKFVQACYNREKALLEMENPTHADIDSGWPS